MKNLIFIATLFLTFLSTAIGLAVPEGGPSGNSSRSQDHEDESPKYPDIGPWTDFGRICVDEKFHKCHRLIGTEGHCKNLDGALQDSMTSYDVHDYRAFPYDCVFYEHYDCKGQSLSTDKYGRQNWHVGKSFTDKASSFICRAPPEDTTANALAMASDTPKAKDEGWMVGVMCRDELFGDCHELLGGDWSAPCVEFEGKLYNSMSSYKMFSDTDESWECDFFELPQCEGFYITSYQYLDPEPRPHYFGHYSNWYVGNIFNDKASPYRCFYVT